MTVSLTPSKPPTEVGTTGAEIVTLRDVGLRLGDVDILAGVTCGVSRGEVVALMGLSGVGKTTVLKIIAGLQKPGAGTVDVAVKDGGIEMVFQRPLLRPHLRVEDNVALGARIKGHDCDVGQLLVGVGLPGKGKSYPNQLSAGEQRRVALARALASRSTVLLLDEPFGGVDELTREQLFTSIGPIVRASGLAVVLVTHSFMEAAFLADRILFLGGKPGNIRREYRVPCSRSGTRNAASSEELFTVVKEIRDHFWEVA
jgi:ABC-type nitrate/sulfonate/bicarbonate transport system ATPase subunit